MAPALQTELEQHNKLILLDLTIWLLCSSRVITICARANFITRNCGAHHRQTGINLDALNEAFTFFWINFSHATECKSSAREMLIFWCALARAPPTTNLLYIQFSAPLGANFHIQSGRLAAFQWFRSRIRGNSISRVYISACAGGARPLFRQWKNRCARLEFFSRAALSLFLKSLPIRCVQIEKDWFHSFCAFAREKKFSWRSLRELYSSDLENCHSNILAFCFFYALKIQS